MKLKYIPADISIISIKEAQSEIKEIITKQEKTETALESSMEQYNRMIYLNFHIQEQFRKKANEINFKIISVVRSNRRIYGCTAKGI